MHREKGKVFIAIVHGNTPKKSDDGWKRRQEKAKKNVFGNRTDALLRSGVTQLTKS
jgi:hypothetical protein